MDNKENKNEEESKISEEKLETILIHLYRGEVQRVNTWRNRLDTTPYWSLVMVAGMITWSYSSPTRSPALILLVIPLTFAVLILEANRYQMHEVWRSRLRLLEENFIANALDPHESLPRLEWRKVLAKDLREPEHKLDFSSAIAVRLRRIYLWIFITIVLSWIMKVILHPTPAEDISTVLTRAGIGFVSGSALVGLVLGFMLALIILAIAGIQPVKEERKGEVLEEEPGYEWRRDKD